MSVVFFLIFAWHWSVFVVAIVSWLHWIWLKKFTSPIVFVRAVSQKQYHHCWAKCAPRSSKEVCARVCICLRWSCQMLIWKTARSNEHGMKQKQCPSINWLFFAMWCIQCGDVNETKCQANCWRVLLHVDKMQSWAVCFLCCSLSGRMVIVLGDTPGTNRALPKRLIPCDECRLSKPISRNCWTQMFDSIPVIESRTCGEKLLLCSSLPFCCCCFFPSVHDAIESEPIPRKKETSKWHKQQRLQNVKFPCDLIWIQITNMQTKSYSTETIKSLETNSHDFALTATKIIIFLCLIPCACICAKGVSRSMRYPRLRGYTSASEQKWLISN